MGPPKVFIRRNRSNWFHFRAVAFRLGLRPKYQARWKIYDDYILVQVSKTICDDAGPGEKTIKIRKYQNWYIFHVVICVLFFHLAASRTVCSCIDLYWMYYVAQWNAATIVQNEISNCCCCCFLLFSYSRFPSINIIISYTSCLSAEYNYIIEIKYMRACHWTTIYSIIVYIPN